MDKKKAKKNGKAVKRKQKRTPRKEYVGQGNR
jgi:hypothetical protein